MQDRASAGDVTSESMPVSHLHQDSKSSSVPSINSVAGDERVRQGQVPNGRTVVRTARYLRDRSGWEQLTGT